MAPVPELVAKKQKRDEAWAAQKAAAAVEARIKSSEARQEAFKRAVQYANEYKQQVDLMLALQSLLMKCFDL